MHATVNAAAGSTAAYLRCHFKLKVHALWHACAYNHAGSGVGLVWPLALAVQLHLYLQLELKLQLGRALVIMLAWPTCAQLIIAY